MNQFDKDQMGRRLKRWQKTINVDGHKIKIVMRSKSSCGHFAGFAATVTDNRGNRLEVPVIQTTNPIDAQDAVWVRFLKEFVS